MCGGELGVRVLSASAVSLLGISCLSRAEHGEGGQCIVAWQVGCPRCLGCHEKQVGSALVSTR